MLNTSVYTTFFHQEWLDFLRGNDFGPLISSGGMIGSGLHAGNAWPGIGCISRPTVKEMKSIE